MSPARITANLPSRDFAATQAFYEQLGFDTAWRDEGWMVMTRDGAQVEFFPHPELDPAESWFSACLRLERIDALYREWAGLGLPTDAGVIPRLTAPWGPDGNAPRMFALIDADGSLWRVIENEEPR